MTNEAQSDTNKQTKILTNKSNSFVSINLATCFSYLLHPQQETVNTHIGIRIKKVKVWLSTSVRRIGEVEVQFHLFLTSDGC